MQIALIGYGKMGKLIEQLSLREGHSIVAIFSRQNGMLATRQHDLFKAEVCIDFSHPEAIIEHVHACANIGKPLVIGTTGWDHHLAKVKEIVNQSGIGCLYAPNFSIGMNLFMQLIAFTGQLMNEFSDYDVNGIEHHHRQKVDSPSGSAKLLSDQLLKQMKRLKSLPFSSIRCGSNPGMHTLLFDSPYDTITLTHQARNREGFASGAIQAAKWIKDKKGFFTLEDFLNSNTHS